MIRPARADELPLLAAIEDAAAELFRGTAMEFVLALPKAPAKAPTTIAPPMLIWVAADRHDQPIGFLEAEIIQGWLHILELSVHPDAQKQGHGRALMERAVTDAAARRLERVSLTTDRDLPWNGPAYRRMGFAELAPDAQPTWLADILAHEISAGFDPSRRIAMARRP